jgi:peptide/nickel transport system substrate-binding protein
MDYVVSDAIWDPLVATALNGTIIPMLASSWSSSPDGLTWTFNLVHNAVWHDNVPLTSADVKFTFETAQKIKAPYFDLGSVNSILTSIDTPDNYTAVFHLNQPSADFLFFAGFAPIVPKHIWENIADPLNYADDHPIGSGPFMFSQRVPGQFVSLVTNPNYYGRKPAYDGVTFTVYPTSDVRVLALIKGDLDASTRIPPSSVAVLLKTPNIKVTVSSNPSDLYLQLNLHRYPLNLREVRQAMTLAIDKQVMLSSVQLGYGDLGSDGQLPPALSGWYNPNAQWLGAGLNSTQRLSWANSLLDNLGFKTGADGVRVTPNGTRLEFTEITAGGGIGLGTRAAELVSSMLAQIGIKVNVKFADTSTVGDTMFSGYGYDMAEWKAGIPGPGSLTDQFLTANAAGMSSGGVAGSWYSNATVDNLLLQSDRTSNYTQRKQIVDQIQMMLMQDVPDIVEFHDGLVDAVRTDRFTGWNPAFLLKDECGFIGVENALAYAAVTPVTSTPSSLSSSSITTSSPAPSGTGPDWLWAVAVVAIVVVALGVYTAKSRSKKGKG